MTEYESQNGMVTDEAIKKYLQDNEYQLTKDPQEMPEIKLNQRKTVLDMYELGEVLARTEQQEGDYKGTYVAFDKENGTYFGLDNRDGKLKEPIEYHSYEEAKRAIDNGESLKASLELTQEVRMVLY